MRGAWGYLGPILLAVGSWMAAPNPHPVLDGVVALAIAAAAGVIGLVAVRVGSQLGVGLALLTGIAVTIPPTVPMGWAGPLLQVAGAVLALEGAASHRTGLPMAPIRAWGIPLALTASGALVAIVALATRVGRESLDITQGIGLAVSAPFLLAAAWGVLRALRTRSEEGTSSLVPAILGLAVVVAGAALLAAPMAHAQSQDPDFRPCPSFGEGEDFFFECMSRLHLLVTPDRTQDVTNDTWTLEPDRLLLIDPGFREDAFANFTFRSAELRVTVPSDAETGCPNKVLSLSRATEAWDEGVTLETAPDGVRPINESRTQTQCAAGSALAFNVTEHFQAWTNASLMHGWRLELAEGSSFNGRGQPSEMEATFDMNAPRVENATSDPEPRNGTILAPVGERLSVDLGVHDPRGGVRAVELRIGERVVASHDLVPNDGGNITVPLGYDVDGSTANGTLSAWVEDWDGNADLDDIAPLRPDREPPTLEPSPDAPVNTSEETWRIPEPIPQEEVQHLTLDLADDSCQFVEACLNLTVLDTAGVTIANRSGEGPASFQLPTDEPGDHSVTLDLLDAAGRLNATTLTYRVSEPVPPALGNVTVTDDLGRSFQQEAGLPLNVHLTAEDVSPPIRVTIDASDDRLLDRTFHTGSIDTELRPTVEAAGTHTLRLTVEDRWGNIATFSERLDVLPARAPSITLPNQTFIPSQAVLDVTIDDGSVPPDNVTVQALRSGSAMPIDVEHAVTPTGIDATVQLPQLLHGEEIRLLVHATDGLGLFTSASRDLTVDALDPDLDVRPSVGARVGGDLWTVADADVHIDASDADSGLDTVRVVEPLGRAIEPQATIPVSEIGTRLLLVEATDAVGNLAEWSGQLRIDDTQPSVELAIDGHHVIATIQEEDSGLSQVRLLVDGAPLSIPGVTGTHRVEIPDVRRGDVVEATLSATDRVGLSANTTQELEVGDGPPDLRLGTLTERSIDAFATDPDGDEVELSARAVHRVNGSSVSLSPTTEGRFQLPAWRGDVRLTVDATAHNATTSAERSFTLGEGPYLSVDLPGEVEPGDEVSVDVSWLRAYEDVRLVVEQDGSRVTVADVVSQEPGSGTATFQLDEEGTYDLTLSARHEDGTVQTASAGQVEVASGPGTVFLVIGILLLVALVGAILLERYDPADGEDG